MQLPIYSIRLDDSSIITHEGNSYIYAVAEGEP